MIQRPDSDANFLCSFALLKGERRGFNFVIMFLQSCRFYSCPDTFLNPPKTQFLIRKNSRIRSYFPFRCISKLACPATAVSDVADIFQNKVRLFFLMGHEFLRVFFSWFATSWLIDCVQVLIAAALSAAIGQLSKPITSTLFYGKNFDVKAAVQAGGFPSTHSSVMFSTILLMHMIIYLFFGLG